jgi:hypothetical protein
MMGYDNENSDQWGGLARMSIARRHDHEQPVWGGQAVSVSIDSFRIPIETTPCRPKAKPAAGIAAVSKSGTNAFHGVCNEYNRRRVGRQNYLRTRRR